MQYIQGWQKSFHGISEGGYRLEIVFFFFRLFSDSLNSAQNRFRPEVYRRMWSVNLEDENLIVALD